MAAGAKVADAAEGGCGERQQGTIAGIGSGHLGDDADAEAGGDEGEDARELIAFEDGVKVGLRARAGSEDVVAEAMAMAEQEEAFLANVLEVGSGRFGEAVAAGDGEKQGFAEEFAGDDVLGADGEGDDGEIEVAGLEAFDETGGDVFREAEIDVGMGGGEGGEAGGEVIGEDGGDGADAETAADA